MITGAANPAAASGASGASANAGAKRGRASAETETSTSNKDPRKRARVDPPRHDSPPSSPTATSNWFGDNVDASGLVCESSANVRRATATIPKPAEQPFE